MSNARRRSGFPAASGFVRKAVGWLRAPIRSRTSLAAALARQETSRSRRQALPAVRSGPATPISRLPQVHRWRKSLLHRDEIPIRLPLRQESTCGLLRLRPALTGRLLFTLPPILPTRRPVGRIGKDYEYLRVTTNSGAQEKALNIFGSASLKQWQQPEVAGQRNTDAALAAWVVQGFFLCCMRTSSHRWILDSSIKGRFFQWPTFAA